MAPSQLICERRFYAQIPIQLSTEPALMQIREDCDAG